MSMKPVKLTVKWQLDAALLSRPVDLNSLVSMSKASPNAFLDDPKTLQQVVDLLVSEQMSKSDKDTKLDALNILANVAYGGKEAVSEVRAVLQNATEWFDDYIAREEEDPDKEPELHKAMVLLLARCWAYRLKTEDVLDLTRGNRRIALCTVVGLLEDGETYSTELKMRQRPGEGQVGQWEHELVVERYEKPMLMQICRLLRGFTHPGTYFEATTDELALYSVERFAEEMSTLLAITLKSHLVEKLSSALFECLFGVNRAVKRPVPASSSDATDEDLLEESDHIAVASVNAFVHNLYFYAAAKNELFRVHILEETMFIPRLILPYLDKCILHVTMLSSSSSSAHESKEEGGESFGWWTHFPQLVSGISSSLRSLIIATFRAAHSKLLDSSLLKLNPTMGVLRAAAFCAHHEYIFALLCILNVNAGAVDLSAAGAKQHSRDGTSASPVELLDALARVFNSMGAAARARVLRRVTSSGALPVSRDTPSYVALLSILSGGEAGQLKYMAEGGGGEVVEDDQSEATDRAEAKEHRERMRSLTSSAAVSEAMGLIAEESKGGTGGTGGMGGESKNSADVSRRGRDAKSSGLTSLGDLPSLSIPSRAASNDGSGASRTKGKGKDRTKEDPSIPREFLCSINGHAMRDPVRCKSTQLVFEKSTIELWLDTRGAVCPITNQSLSRSDLQPDDELRNRIMRYHIQQTSLRTAESNADDLYDF